MDTKKIVELLIQVNEDNNRPNENGKTPAQLATQRGYNFVANCIEDAEKNTRLKNESTVQGNKK